MVPVEAAGFKAALRHWLPIASAARGGTVAGAPRIEWCYRAPDVSWRGMYFRATKLIATAEPSTILAAADSRPCTRRRSSGTKPCLLLLLHGAGRYVCARTCMRLRKCACVRPQYSGGICACCFVFGARSCPATWGPNAHAHFTRACQFIQRVCASLLVKDSSVKTSCYLGSPCARAFTSLRILTSLVNHSSVNTGLVD